MFNLETILTFVLILLPSVIIHEVMHGVVAGYFGDDTAKRAGRLTLNPVPHIDLFGSIIMPLGLLMVGSPVILGAAKPVPIDPSQFTRKRLGIFFVSLAGPLTNLVLAAICILILKLGLGNSVANPILFQGALINLVLAVFNAMPVPPLDGSKMVASLLPERAMELVFRLENYGFIVLFALLYLGVFDRVIQPVYSVFLKILGL